MKIVQKFNLKLAGLAMAAGTMLAGCDTSGEYTVKYNADNTLVYTALSDTTDVHVMIYDPRLMPEYKYIRPGDVISGPRAYLSAPTASPTYNEWPCNVPSIKSVNGKDLENARGAVIRDSILHQIKQK